MPFHTLRSGAAADSRSTNLGCASLLFGIANGKWCRTCSGQDVHRVGSIRWSAEADEGPVIDGALGEALRFSILKQVSKIGQSNPYFFTLYRKPRVQRQSSMLGKANPALKPQQHNRATWEIQLATMCKTNVYLFLRKTISERKTQLFHP